MDTEDRWYVRFRGHTLGPLTSEQVKSSVRRKELGPDDKLASAANPTWRALRTQEEFLRCWEALSRPIPAELAPLPSPKILWQKKRAPQPVAPAPAPMPPAEKPIAANPAPLPAAAPGLTVVAPKAAPTAPAKAKAKPKLKAKPAKRPRPTTARRPVKAKAEPAPAAEKKTEDASQAIPEKILPVSAVVPAAEPIILARSEPAASAAPAAAAPKLAEETLSLLEALRDWNRKERESTPRVQSAPAPAPFAGHAPVPPESSPSPAIARPVFSAHAEPEEAPATKRGIELKLNLVISKQFIFISGIVLAAALAAVIYTLTEAKKMRGPVDSRLPDPSSPTINPSSENDPIPQLKAPTRPKRD